LKNNQQIVRFRKNQKGFIMSWYKVEKVSDKDEVKIQNMFLSVYASSGKLKKGMALFSGTPSHNDVSCIDSTNIYFTPACASCCNMKVLMDSCKAVTCEEPTRETESEFALLCGNPEEWQGHVWCPDYP
jgi:hypothetical protein